VKGQPLRLLAMQQFADIQIPDLMPWMRILDTRPDSTGHSSLNNDGRPLQLCVSSDERQRRVRLLVDPAHDEPDRQRRLHRGMRALRRLEEFGVDGDLVRRIIGRLERVLPRSPGEIDDLVHGAVWLAVDLERAGAGAYASTRFGPTESRWARIRRDLGLDRVVDDDVWQRLEARLEPASVAFEGRAGHKPRTKIYARLQRPCRLGELGVPEFVDSRMTQFLQAVIENRMVGQSGLVVSFEVETESGRMGGGKVDVCAHCVQHTGLQWARILDDVAVSQGLVPPSLHSVLALPGIEVAFVGLGIDGSGSARLNTYLKEA